MKKKLFIFFILFSLIFVGCNNEKETHKITIATLKGPSAMGMIKMIDSLENSTNSDMDITIYNEPIQVRKLMLQGEVDFAILPTTMGSILYNKGVPYQLAAIPVWGTLYLFGKDTTISTWNDLKGKKINLMAKGMTPDVLFKQLLIQNGLDPEKDLKLDYSFPTHIDLANAVASNQVDLAVISEPLVSLVKQKNNSIHSIFNLNTEWTKQNEGVEIAQTALLVSKDFAKKYPAKLKSILKNYENSSQWVNNNKTEASQLIVKYHILPNEEVALSSIPACNLNFKYAYPIKNQIIKYLDIFYNLNPNIIGGKIPDDNFFLNAEP